MHRPQRSAFILGHAAWAATPEQPRPGTALLPPNERRRAPASVLMALRVAEDAARAAAAAGVDLARIGSVFASAHGDLDVVDALCRTLAENPDLLSPLRFHHSVHNAASGYFAIGAANHRPSNAVAAAEGSVAAGLLEALGQVAADDEPVLFVAFDTAAPAGPLWSVNDNRQSWAMAMVLAPQAPGRRLRWALAPQPHEPGAAARAAPGPALAAAAALRVALADKRSTSLSLPLHVGLDIALEIDPA